MASVEKAKSDIELAKKAIDAKNYEQCVQLLSVVIPTAPQSTNIRLLRATSLKGKLKKL
jgi:hypothetical protein